MTKKLHINKLDSIRGFAAFYIFLTHFVLILSFLPKQIKLFFSFGQELVVVFFILSGFVIYLSVYQKTQITFQSYFVKRFYRIYFPLFFCFIISAFIFYLNGIFFKRFSWIELVGNLLMLQDFSEVKPGNWFKPFLDNLPLWSLGYEWWFYLLFYPFYKILPNTPYRIYLVSVVSIISYLTYVTLPNHASLVFSYFIIWWSGVEAATIFTQQGRFTYKNMQPIIFSLLLMSVITAIPLIGTEDIRLGYYPFLIFRHFFDACIFISVGTFWYQKGLIGFDKIFSVFSKVAPISYSLYILQYPILTKWLVSDNNYNLWLVCTVKVILILFLSYLIEIKILNLLKQWIKS